MPENKYIPKPGDFFTNGRGCYLCYCIATTKITCWYLANLSLASLTWDNIDHLNNAKKIKLPQLDQQFINTIYNYKYKERK